MRSGLAAFLLNISIEASSLGATARIGPYIRAIREHGDLGMIGAVFYLGSCEFLLAVAAVHGDSVAPYFPEDASPAEMILLSDKRDELIDFPGPIYHMFGDDASMEINEYSGFLALHPLSLFQRE